MRQHSWVEKDWESRGAEKHCDKGLPCGDLRLSPDECGSVDADQALAEWFLAAAMRVLGPRLTLLPPRKGSQGAAMN